MEKKIIIAIDGFSSSGKSTLAKGLAKKLSYIYVDTGAMYRAVTLFAIKSNIIKDNFIDEEELENRLGELEISFKINEKNKKNETYLNGVCVESEIRGMKVSRWVSPISALKFVRTALVSQQRKMGVNRGVVMDGRDIGTVVFPDAELKLFVTATPEIRAERRYLELYVKDNNVSFDEVLHNIKSRDEYDQNRKESPLRMADDAILLDNSELSIEEQLDWAISKVREVLENV